MSEQLIAHPEGEHLPRILIVDDDEVNLLLTSFALREQGFVVRQANSGRDALRSLSEWYPDILVLDAIMPGLDGFETCQELRRIPGFESLPVLMLTGLDDESSINRAYEAGATDFFVKSQQWSLLAGRLRYLLRSAKTRQELELSKSKLALAQELARMGSVDWYIGSPSQLVFSEESLRVFGALPKSRLSLKQILRMMPEQESRTMITTMREALKSQSVLCHDFQLLIRNGEHRIIHVEAEPQYNELAIVSSYSGIVQDVTDRHNAEDRIHKLSNFDVLTGLPNRRHIFWRAERALEPARKLSHSVAVLQLGLDRFKVINENLGHHAGDELLVEVARRLRGCVKHYEHNTEKSTDFNTHGTHRSLEAVGRLGADEFVVLLPEVDSAEDALRVAERLQDALRHPILAGNQECFMTSSIGVACFPGHSENVADLLRQADVAMDMAKEQGRNTIRLYDPRLASVGRINLDVDTALHKALEKQELVLHYQPKIDTRTGLMIGAEALMRWQRGGKLVSPADFIPIAEATGLINDMSMWAIEEAARQAQVWKERFNFTGAIAVNMPSRLFNRDDLVDVVASLIKGQGASLDMIELEITETGLMQDLGGVVTSLHKLNEIGIEISIDDFGTGYSALSYLTTLPISELKIDRSFVRDMGKKPQSTAVVSAIVALARALDLRVIAEGVEHLEQAITLGEMGCHICQGFFFAKPMPSHELDVFMENNFAQTTSISLPIA